MYGKAWIDYLEDQERQRQTVVRVSEDLVEQRTIVAVEMPAGLSVRKALGRAVDEIFQVDRNIKNSCAGG